MSIPYRVLIAQLYRYARQCEAAAIRARVRADMAWQQVRQAEQDECEDAMDRAQEIIERRRITGDAPLLNKTTMIGGAA